MSRKSFVQLLEKVTPAKLASYRSKSQTFLNEENGAPRVFNDFDVLDQKAVEETCTDIQKTLETFKSTPDAIDKNDESNIKSTLKKLAKIACEDLLDKHGNVNHKIIELLEWKSDNNALMNHQDSIICSFMNAAYAQIEASSPNFNPDKYPNFTPFINKYLSVCVIEVLRERGLNHLAKKVEDNSAVMKIMRFASENPGTTFGLLTGFAAVAAFFGVFACKGYELLQKSNAPEAAKGVAPSQLPGAKPF